MPVSRVVDWLGFIAYIYFTVLNKADNEPCWLKKITEIYCYGDILSVANVYFISQNIREYVQLTNQ